MLIWLFVMLAQPNQVWREITPLVPVDLFCGQGETSLQVHLRFAMGELLNLKDLTFQDSQGPRAYKSRILQRHPDQSASVVLVEVPLRSETRGNAQTHSSSNVSTFFYSFPRMEDPASLILDTTTTKWLSEKTEPNPGIKTGSLVSLMSTEPFQFSAGLNLSSNPEWWNEVSVRKQFPKTMDFPSQIDFVQTAYAEKGRHREAIILFSDIAERAHSAENLAFLRAYYEMAYGYRVYLKDHARALYWYGQCRFDPVSRDPKLFENQLKADLGLLQSLVGLEKSMRSLYMIRLLARTLLFEPTPLGNQILPEVFLEIGHLCRDLELVPQAQTAFEACLKAGRMLPKDVAPHVKAPCSAAKAALRVLSGESLDFRQIPSGTYSASAFGYNSLIVVEMVFDDKKCQAFSIPFNGDKRPLDVGDIIPVSVVENQTLELDGITGATVTSRAILSAATEALHRAKEEVGTDAKPPPSR